MASLLVLGIIGLLIAVFATVFYLLVLSGLFHTIDIKTKKSPVAKLHVAYKFFRGKYGSGGHGALFTEVSKAAPHLRCFGVYYDNPNTVPGEQLRSIVGTVLSEGDEEPNAELKNQLIASGFKIADFPEVSNMVQTTFPNVTTLSLFIAIFRVYPALQEYVRVNDLCAYPFMELYQSGEIYFLAPLSQQNNFVVPEAGDVEISDLSAGDTEDQDPEELQRSSDSKEKAAPEKPGDDSTNSESSFEQLDTPAN